MSRVLRVTMQEMLAYPRESVRPRSNLNRRHCCFLVCLHFAVSCYDRCRVSGYSKQIFPLSMCIEAPESTTNCLSSGFVEDGAVGHQTSEGEKNVALSFSSSLRIPFAISHATLRAHRSCFKVDS